LEQDKKRILQMVKDGTITIEEALSLLETLEEAEKISESTKQLSLDIDVEKNDSGPTDKKGKPTLKDSIFSFVDKAFHKVKEIDIDFHHSVDFSHVFYENAQMLHEINLEIANGSISLQPWDHSDIRMECKVKVYREKEIEEAKKKFLQGVTFQLKNGIFTFTSDQKLMKVETVVFIPSYRYEKIYTKLLFGNITIHELYAEEWIVKTTNGHIGGQWIEGNHATIESGNGRIELKHAFILKNETETINGSIHVEGKFHQLDLQTLTGRIFCHIHNRNIEKLFSKTVASPIHIQLSQGVVANGEVKTNLGNIDVSIDGIHITEEKKDFAQKKLCFQPIIQEDHSLTLFAESKTGSIFIENVTS